VVVTDTGGLGEVVQHGKNGLKAMAGNPASLAENIIWMLSYPEQARALSAQASRDVETEYNWEKIARATIRVYQEVEEEYQRSPWRWTPAGHRAPFAQSGMDATDPYDRYTPVAREATPV